MPLTDGIRSSSTVMIVVRSIESILSIVVLGLMAAVSNWYNVETMTATPSEINFLIFVPIWSFISVLYHVLAPGLAPEAYHPIAALVIECLNVVFWFSGFVSLAAFLSKLLFCRGMVCSEAQAGAVFSALQFITWSSTLFFTAKEVFKGRFHKTTASRRNVVQMKETVA
ncbi:hypothetical protein VTK73DRAFT_9993 [Phialemonium thermophilum]|uniref:MARVEL domain-containing protein n=1 Tax=Phialemonium thermophilum TaxID=223376 RepID=A0ABR3Y431_9PEZI